MKYLSNMIHQIAGLNKFFAGGLMVTTAYMAYTVMQSVIQGSPYVPDFLETACVIGGTLLLTFAIDDNLPRHGVNSMAAIMDKSRATTAGAFLVIGVMSMLFLLRLGFSGSATWLTGRMVVIETTPAPDKDDALAIGREKNAAITQARQEGTGAAERAFQAEKERAAMVVELALNSGNKEQRKIYERAAEKDNWFFTSSAGSENSAYVRRVRKAEKEAAKIVAAATTTYNTRLASVERQIAAIETDVSYTAAAKAVEAEVGRSEILTNVKTSMWMIADILMIVGFFGTTYLLAFHITTTHTPITAFFPEEPGLIQVITDGVKSTYSLAVAGVASVVAELKGHGSTRMQAVATSVTSSSKKWKAATAAYSVAMQSGNEPATPQHPAAPYRNTTATPPPEPQQASPPPPALEQSGAQEIYRFRQPERPENKAVPPEHRQYVPPPPLPVEPQHATPQQAATPERNTATPQHRNTTESATPAATDSGKLYRAHLSKANQYLSQGNNEAARRRLSNAYTAAVNKAQKDAITAIMKQLDNE